MQLLRLPTQVLRFFCAVTAAATLGSAAFISQTARATTELDKRFALDSVGFLRSWDNVDGLFVDYVSGAYKDYFAHQSRFSLQDLSKADHVFDHSKLPYIKVIDDPEILGQLARATRTESVVRTKVVKEGPLYRFTLDWLHSPSMDLMASETFTLQEPGNGKALSASDIKDELKKALDRMILKVPFLTNVTGRDNNSVTVSLGTGMDVHPGDDMLVGTLDEVKKHPLLKQISDWRLSEVGRVHVDSIDDGIAFCKVTEEVPGRQIARYQKVTQIIRKPMPQAPLIIDEKAEQTQKRMDETPRNGWVAMGLMSGGFSRSYGIAPSGAPASGFEGGAFSNGGGVEGQAWLTRDFFIDLGFDYGFYTYTQHAENSTASNQGLSGNFSILKADVGYSYLLSNDFFGPKAWVKLGYMTAGYGLALDSTQSVAGTSFKSLYIGVGGDLPIRSQWGVQLNFNIGVLTSVTEDGNSGGGAGLSGNPGSSSGLEFFAGGYYRFANRMSFRAGIDVLANNANFATSTNTANTVSQKVISFAPALLYYF